MQDPILVRRLFTTIAERYDLANHLLSGGLDPLWRMRVIQKTHSWKCTRILDLATGSGDLALALRKAHPHAQVVGVDFCQAMLLQAKRKGLDALVHGDGTQLPFQSEAFDTLTIAFGLRNMESWSKALQEMSRVLTPGGRLLILDFSLPAIGWLRAVYRVYLHHILPILAGWVTGNREAYRYLGDSIEKFPSGSKMRDMLQMNGFYRVRVQPLCFGIVSLYTAEREATILPARSDKHAQ